MKVNFVRLSRIWNIIIKLTFVHSSAIWNSILTTLCSPLNNLEHNFKTLFCTRLKNLSTVCEQSTSTCRRNRYICLGGSHDQGGVKKWNFFNGIFHEGGEGWGESRVPFRSFQFFLITPWLLKHVLHIVWALYYVYIVVEVTLNRAKYGSQRSDQPDNFNFEPIIRALKSDIFWLGPSVKSVP